MAQKPKCTHTAYATSISARKAAEGMGLNARRVVDKCSNCGKWKVVP